MFRLLTGNTNAPHLDSIPVIFQSWYGSVCVDLPLLNLGIF